MMRDKIAEQVEGYRQGLISPLIVADQILSLEVPGWVIGNKCAINSINNYECGQVEGNLGTGSCTDCPAWEVGRPATQAEVNANKAGFNS